MSHFTSVRSKLNDIDVLKNVLREMSIPVLENAVVRGGECELKADLVAVLDGGYDLGWFRNADGSLTLMADLWGVARGCNLPELMNTINQKYAVQKTLAAVKRPGLQQANVRLSVQA